MKRKNTKKNKKKNKITKKANKKELEVILKTLKNIKVSKQINRLKGIKLLPKKKINKIINRQVNLLKKFGLRNLQATADRRQAPPATWQETEEQ